MMRTGGCELQRVGLSHHQKITPQEVKHSAPGLTCICRYLGDTYRDGHIQFSARIRVKARWAFIRCRTGVKATRCGSHWAELDVLYVHIARKCGGGLDLVVGRWHHWQGFVRLAGD